MDNRNEIDTILQELQGLTEDSQLTESNNFGKMLGRNPMSKFRDEDSPEEILSDPNADLEIRKMALKRIKDRYLKPQEDENEE